MLSSPEHSQSKIFGERSLRLNSLFTPGIGEDGLDLRAEQQGIFIVAIVERLDPQPITRKK
jgi:hypothetical protein